jgi:hypothetical protein
MVMVMGPPACPVNRAEKDTHAEWSLHPTSARPCRQELRICTVGTSQPNPERLM